jgi:hypothetical protein
MHKSLMLWILSFLLTAGSAWFQRVTGPTYPLSGTAHFGDAGIPWRLERSHGGESDAPVSITAVDTSVSGFLGWRRNGTEDEWRLAGMEREGGVLRGSLPLQPPAGKLEYRVILRRGADTLAIPADEPAVIRFKGEVPPAVLAVHILLMFAGMLVSTRTGLSAFSGGDEAGSLTLVTIGLLVSGGLVLGPVVQKYAFGAFWTGWPFGTDLTDNKTVAALAAWVAVAIVRKHVRRPAYWALAAALITLAVFMIPHSLFGSAYDYRGTGNGHSAPSVSFLVRADADECAPYGCRHR